MPGSTQAGRDGPQKTVRVRTLHLKFLKMELRSLTCCTNLVRVNFLRIEYSKQFHIIHNQKSRVEQSWKYSSERKKSNEGRPVDALALGGDEGRDKLR